MPKIDITKLQGFSPNAEISTMDKQKNAIKNLEDDKYMKIEVDLIDYNSDNKNYNQFDTEQDIENLADEINLLGLLFPLVVWKYPEGGRYYLLSGEKRIRAVKLLRWKKVYCHVFFGNLTELELEEIKNITNLPRDLTNKQKMIAYAERIDAIENASPEERKRYLKQLQISKQKYNHYKKIIENVSQEDFEKFKAGEIDYKDLKKIADAQFAEISRQKQINEAVQLFAQAQENLERVIYQDDANTLYFIEYDEVRKLYVIKYKDFTTNALPYMLRSSEVEHCPDEKTTQAFLDKYAIIHNLRVCAEEQYLEMIKEGKKESKPVVPHITVTKVPLNNQFPEIVTTPADDENALLDYEEVIKEEPSTIESAKEMQHEDNKTINAENNPTQTETPNPIKQDKMEQLSILPDTEEKTDTTTVSEKQETETRCVNKFFEAKELSTGKIVRGYIAPGKDGLYLIRGNLNVTKENKQGDLISYTGSFTACKIDPDSIKIIDKK